ncbi:MAG: GC-type dockerin domain-anchored protein [Phycisphaerales bacterium]
MKWWMIAGASACAMGSAQGAPELLVNGGGEQPLALGWSLVSGSARTTGLIDGGAVDRGGLGVLTPSQGLGFVVLGPSTGGTCTIEQLGDYPFGSDRVFWRGKVRVPAGGSLRATLSAFDDLGEELFASSFEVVPTDTTWADASLTYAIPSLAEHWQLRLEAIDAGPFGVHADAMSLIGTCLADFNGDRILNFFDINDFLVAFIAGDPNADLTGNGVIDFFDIRELIDSFEFECD